MDQYQRRRFILGVIAYFMMMLIILPATVAGVIYLLTRNDEPCVWEDCSDINGGGPQCVNMGDTACLVVPD